MMHWRMRMFRLQPGHSTGPRALALVAGTIPSPLPSNPQSQTASPKGLPCLPLSLIGFNLLLLGLCHRGCDGGHMVIVIAVIPDGR
jgi:hypothetical protein